MSVTEGIVAVPYLANYASYSVADNHMIAIVTLWTPHPIRRYLGKSANCTVRMRVHDSSFVGLC